MTAQEKQQRQEARDRIKAKLYVYRDAQEEIKQIRGEIARMEAELTGPSTSNWDGMPRSSGYGDPTPRAASAIMRVREQYETQLTRLAEEQLAVEEMLDSLPSKERRLLRFRYIDGLTWEGVCVAMTYSWRQTHNIHGAALDKLVEAGYHN